MAEHSCGAWRHCRRVLERLYVWFLEVWFRGSFSVATSGLEQQLHWGIPVVQRRLSPVRWSGTLSGLAPQSGAGSGPTTPGLLRFFQGCEANPNLIQLKRPSGGVKHLPNCQPIAIIEVLPQVATTTTTTTTTTKSVRPLGRQLYPGRMSMWCGTRGNDAELGDRSAAKIVPATLWRPRH